MSLNPNGKELKDFLHSYLATALWSSSGDDDVPLDRKHGIEHFAPEALAMAEKDCAAFESKARSLLDTAGISDAQAGHDFWLTRNGHGTGFWDRGDGIVGDALAALAHEAHETDAYVGDDGQIYFSR